MVHFNTLIHIRQSIDLRERGRRERGLELSRKHWIAEKIFPKKNFWKKNFF